MQETWRTAIVSTVARLLAIVAPVLLVLTYLAGDTRPGLHVGGALAVTGAAIAGWSRRIGVGMRAGILWVPAIGFSGLVAFDLGMRPMVALVPCLASTIVGLVRGTRMGLIGTVLGSALVAAAGTAGGSAPLVVWVRHGFIMAVFTAMLVLLVSRAVARIEAAFTERRDAEAQLRAALEAAQVGTWAIDVDTRALAWDPFGGVVSELAMSSLPRTVEGLMQLVHPEDRARTVAALDAALQGANYHIETRLDLPGLGLRWLEARGRRQGHVLVGMAIDITARREEEARRGEAQETLLALARSDAAARGDLAAALRAITEAGARLLLVARCSLWRFDDSGTRLDCIELHASSGHAIKISLAADAAPTYFETLTTQRSLAVADTREDPRTRELLEVYLARNRIVALLDSPIHVGGKLTGVLCHEHVGDHPRRFSADDEDLSAALADLASRAFEAAERARAERELALAYSQLAVVTRRTEAAREDERRLIARELHDDLGQSLTAIKMGLQLAIRDGAPRERLVEAIEIADRAIATTRELSRAMRPPLLDEIGLEPALQAFVEEQERLSGVIFELSASPPPGRLAPELEIAVFRIVQEAVTNALRHAEAEHVKVSVERHDGAVELAIHDDGRGFDVEAAMARTDAAAHLGLIGMRERVRALGGLFTVSSRPTRGTEVRAEIPL